MTLKHYDHVANLFRRALANGAKRQSATRVTWDLSANCESPYTNVHVGRVSRTNEHKHIIVQKGTRGTITVEIVTRCRKCDSCRKAKKSLWRYRVKYETHNALRTWFGTLTMSPEKHTWCVYSARAQVGNAWNALSEEQRFKEVAAIALKEVTKYIKRFRKNSKAEFRYFLVTERHKSGLPHFHMLVHEVNADRQVRHKHLSEAWDWGFERWRLLEPDNPNQALYLCKYITKDVTSRVRASQRYGQPS